LGTKRSKGFGSLEAEGLGKGLRARKDALEAKNVSQKCALGQDFLERAGPKQHTSLKTLIPPWAKSTIINSSLGRMAIRPQSKKQDGCQNPFKNLDSYQASVRQERDTFRGMCLVQTKTKVSTNFNLGSEKAHSTALANCLLACTLNACTMMNRTTPASITPSQAQLMAIAFWNRPVVLTQTIAQTTAKCLSSNLPPLQVISINSVDGCRLLLDYPAGTKATPVQNAMPIA
jgi:hypothetical protein